MFIARYKWKQHGKYPAKWQVREYQKPNSLADVLGAMRREIEALEMWAIYRVSDMRIMAQSKNYHWDNGRE